MLVQRITSRPKSRISRFFSTAVPQLDRKKNDLALKIDPKANKQSSKTIHQPNRAKLDLSSEKKFSKFIREFNRSSPQGKLYTLDSTNHETHGTNVGPQKTTNPSSFPRVPSTSHLDLRKFRQDIFYQGYRPLLLPIKSDKVFKVSIGQQSLPNIWNKSALGTQHFKEMDNVPFSVVAKLRPFEKPEMPKKKEEVDWKDFFLKRGFSE